MALLQDLFRPLRPRQRLTRTGVDAVGFLHRVGQEWDRSGFLGVLSLEPPRIYRHDSPSPRDLPPPPNLARYSPSDPHRTQRRCGRADRFGGLSVVIECGDG